MAKTQRYSEGLLLEAVVKYASTNRTKIKATELAMWARENVPGLEGVRDYHFTRPIIVRDAKGKTKRIPKKCTEKINEYNKDRSIDAETQENVLLHANSLDDFFELSEHQQRKVILETREAFEKLKERVKYLSLHNELLQKEKQAIKGSEKEKEDVIGKLELVVKRLDYADKRINYVLKQMDENNRKEKLAEIGITDGRIELTKLQKELNTDAKKVVNFQEIIGRYIAMEPEEPFIERVMKGIDNNAEDD